MVKKDSNEGGGFARYWQESGSILLPLATTGYHWPPLMPSKLKSPLHLKPKTLQLKKKPKPKKGNYRNRRAQG